MAASVSPTEPARAGVLAIDGELTIATAATRFRELRPRLAGIGRISFDGVTAIDSAGVAVVLALQAAAGMPMPSLTGLPARFDQLCVAHRVGGNGN